MPARRSCEPACSTGLLRPRLAAACLLAGLLAAGGCQATLPREMKPEDPPDENAELIEYISDLQYVTAEAAYRAVYILASGQVYEGDYAGLKQQMEQKNLLVADVDSRVLLDRGQIGALIARALEIRTGLNWQLTKLGRYAWRELQYRRIVRTTGEFGYVSGGEFLGILARAEDYLYELGRAPRQQAELGEDPSE